MKIKKIVLILLKFSVIYVFSIDAIEYKNYLEYGVAWV